MADCETCAKRETCTKDIGTIFGCCKASYVPDSDALYARLDQLEGCEENPVYAAEIQEIRAQLADAE